MQGLLRHEKPSDLDVVIGVEFPQREMGIVAAGDIAQEAARQIERIPGARAAPRIDDEEIDDYVFLVEEYELLQRGKRIYDSLLPESARPCFEIVRITKGITPDDGWLLYRGLGDDVSGMEIGDWTIGRKTCGTCGNDMQDIDYTPKVRGGKLPKTKTLMTCYSNLRLMSRKSFREAYERSGLSGLRFSKMLPTHTQGVELHRVRAVLHEWQDQTAVCSECQMKTNARTTSVFNLHEEYRHDFQLVNLHDDYRYVLSVAGARFLSEHCATGPDSCAFPIVPGYLEDMIRLEAKFFANGEYPTRVLWKRSAQG